MKKTGFVATALAVVFMVLSSTPIFALDPAGAVGKEFKGRWCPPGGTGYWPSSVEVKSISSVAEKKYINLTYRQKTGESLVTDEIQTEIIEEPIEKLPQFKFQGKNRSDVKFVGTFQADGRLKMELNLGNKYFMEFFEVEKPKP